jgi:hypothetical protein
MAAALRPSADHTTSRGKFSTNDKMSDDVEFIRSRYSLVSGIVLMALIPFVFGSLIRAVLRSVRNRRGGFAAAKLMATIGRTERD